MNPVILREALMKLDSFLADMHEVLEDPDTTPDAVSDAQQIIDIVSTIEAKLMNDLKQITGEEEMDFLYDLDAYDLDIEKYPEADMSDIDDMLDNLI